MKKVKIGLSILGFLIFYIFWVKFIIFIFMPGGSEYPSLRNRLGTIMWHSADRNGRTDEAMYDPKAETHVYCYYPKSNVVFTNKEGRYLIKRIDNIDACKDWFGISIFYEGSWVSEREKIWWSLEQQLDEELNTAKIETYTL